MGMIVSWKSPGVVPPHTFTFVSVGRLGSDVPSHFTAPFAAAVAGLGLPVGDIQTRKWIRI